MGVAVRQQNPVSAENRPPGHGSLCQLDRSAGFVGWGAMLNRLKIAPLVRTLAFAVILALPGATARAEASAPQAVVKNFYVVLLEVMKKARELGFDGRYQKLKPAIETAYNLPLMSRLSIGPQWQSLTPQEQEQLSRAFAEFTVATYANRFDDYSGEKFEVQPETAPASGGVIVQSRLVKSNGEPVTLNYLMREADGRWQIIDVFLSGTISELATRRSEFTSILRRDGAQGLLNVLNRRISELKVS
jgi:phospholipid transport system substrate-binding protein